MRSNPPRALARIDALVSLAIGVVVTGVLAPVLAQVGTTSAPERVARQPADPL